MCDCIRPTDSSTATWLRLKTGKKKQTLASEHGFIRVGGKGILDKNETKNYTKHHIIPQSRCKELDIKNPHVPWNITILTKRDHALYHQLFGTRTPEEILEFLKDKFWNGWTQPPSDSRRDTTG